MLSSVELLLNVAAGVVGLFQPPPVQECKSLANRQAE